MVVLRCIQSFRLRGLEEESCLGCLAFFSCGIGGSRGMILLGGGQGRLYWRLRLESKVESLTIFYGREVVLTLNLPSNYSYSSYFST
jgi:hypothetical protein